VNEGGTLPAINAANIKLAAMWFLVLILLSFFYHFVFRQL
jgi:hypothetical protein